VEHDDDYDLEGSLTRGGVRWSDREEPHFWRGAPVPPRNPSSRFLAAEMEIAGGDTNRNGHELGGYLNPVITRWHAAVVSDGSLPSSGFEINTAPASGIRFVEQVEEIGEALRHGSAKVDVSCGLHIHVDARDFTYQEMQRLVVLYTKVEDGLFAILPPSRQNNRYCMRSAQAYAGKLVPKRRIRVQPANMKLKAGIGEVVYGSAEAIESHARSKYAGNRYYALNLHSWFHRGTVEFRMGAGTTRADRVIPWATLLAGLLDYAKEHKVSDILALRGNPLEVLKLAAPSDDHRAWIDARRARFARRVKFDYTD
jgi:hypothetical protein